MKTTYLKQLIRNAKRAHAWAAIVAPSQAKSPYNNGVLRHNGSAY